MSKARNGAAFIHRTTRQLWLRRALFQVHLWTGLLVGLLDTVIGLCGSAIVFRDSLNTRLPAELYRRIETKNPPDFDAMLASVSESLLSRTILAAGPTKGRVWIFQMGGERRPGYRTFPVRLKCFAHPGLRLQAYDLTRARATEDADLKRAEIAPCSQSSRRGPESGPRSSLDFQPARTVALSLL